MFGSPLDPRSSGVCPFWRWGKAEFLSRLCETDPDGAERVAPTSKRLYLGEQDAVGPGGRAHTHVAT